MPDDTFGGDNVTDNTGGDEDDHDPALLELEPYMDLALTKVLNSAGPFITGSEDANYLVDNVDQGARALDVTDPVRPLQLEGESLQAEGKRALCFRAAAERVIEIIK